MDCDEARAMLCSLHDEDVSASAREAATAHAAECRECASFAAALATVDAIPAPTAPSGLADRIAHAVSVEAAAMAAAAALEPAGTPDAPQGPAGAVQAVAGAALRPVQGLPPWLTRARLWAATAGVSLVAAGIVVAVLVTRQTAGQMATTTFEDVGTADASRGFGAVGAPSAAAPSPPATPATAPDYIAFDAYAYVAVDSGAVAPSDLTTIGVTQTALRGSEVSSLAVLRATGSDDVFVAVPGGGYQKFASVTRQMSGRTFRLVAGTLDHFGVWPGLPSDWSQPTSTDGSPYYRAAGTDSLGVPVFVRVGQTPDLGFIVGPGTSAGDPAAGNPNWTLWLPAQ